MTYLNKTCHNTANDMVHPLKALTVMLDDLSSITEPTRWKERTNSSKLSSDLYKHAIV